MPFEPEWRKQLKGRFDAAPDSPNGQPRGEEPWWSREPAAADQPGEVDLFGNPTQGRELVEPAPSTPVPLPSAPSSVEAGGGGRRRRGRLLTAVALLLALAAGAAGGVVVERARAEAAAADFPPEVQVITRPVPQVPPACQASLDKATQALVLAAQVQRALAEHTTVMNKLMQGKMSGQDALRVGMPSLARGAKASDQLDNAAKQFSDLSRQCGP